MDLFERAMIVSRKKLRPSSLSVYRSLWQRYCTRLQNPATLSPAEPGRESPCQMRQAIQGAGNYSTQKRLFALIRRIYQALEEIDGMVLTTAPTALYREFLPVYRPAVQSLEEDWQQALVDAAYQYARGWRGARLAAMAAILSDAALKTKELRELKFSQLTGAPVSQIRIGPSSNYREMELSAATQSILHAWLQVHPAPESDYVFVSDERGLVMDATTLWRQLKRITQQSLENPPVKHFGTGVIRATKAQSMYKQGYPVTAISSFLGHRQKASTGELLERIY